MPFCPHCGKPAGDQASKCPACGEAFGKATAAARGGFRGTMMMTSPATAGVATEAGPAEGTPKAVQPAALKATMLGGIATDDLVQAARARALESPPHPRPPALAGITDVASPGASDGTKPTANPRKHPASPPASSQAGTGAPQPQAAPRVAARRGAYPADTQDDGRRWIIAGAVGMLVIAGLGWLAASLMGLL